MSDDLKLNRDDFDDCFVDAPPPVSVADDLARGRHRLRRRRRMAGGAVAAVVAAVVIAVPIVTSRATRPIFDPAVPPTVQPTGTCGPATLKAADAITDPAQRPITDVKFRSSMEAGQSVALQALGSTGEILVEIGDRESGGALIPGRLYIEDPVTGVRTLVRGDDDLHVNTRTSGARLDQNFAVWVEEVNPELVEPGWVMYAFNRATGEITEVTGSDAEPDEDDLPPVAVELWNGSAYWVASQDRPVAGRTPAFNVYQRRLDSAEPARRLVESVFDAVATEGWLYHLRYKEGGSGYEVHRLSLADPTKSELIHEDATKNPQMLTAFGELSAWSEDMDLVVYRGAKRIAQIAPPKGIANFSEAGNGLIGFTAGEHADQANLLLDLRNGCRLYQLDHGGRAALVYLGGNTIAWAVPDPDHELRVAWHIGRLR